MSSFKGFLRDTQLEFIAIDNFDKTTYNCRAFFLSHLHWDHYQGLWEFLPMLNKSEDKFLYCSPITGHLLMKRISWLNKNKIVMLDINKSFIFKDKNVNTDVVVTYLPTGHCPGAVMILIEYDNRRILYSGDFRVYVDDLKKMKSRLSNPDGSVIDIDELYLDTTWAVPSQFDDFPSRESSKNVITETIESWLLTTNESQQQLKILLSIPATFGSEYLFLSLFKKFKKPIFIHKYHYYSYIEEMVNCVVPFEEIENNQDKWIIHACLSNNLRKCPLYKCKNKKIIKPCALYFIQNSSCKFPVHELYNVPYFSLSEELKVFYSSHCSLNELRNFVKYVKPKKIIPSVEHESLNVDDMISLINSDVLSIKYQTYVERQINSKTENMLLTLKKRPSKRSREEKILCRMEIRKKMNLDI
ncbi:hypothetical protein PGB90_005668 [Kerria lacca]